MYKLTIKLSNDSSPLEEAVIPNGVMEKDIFVEDIHDMEDVFHKIYDVIGTLKNGDRTSILIRVFDERGNTILDGSIKEGSFHGVKMS
jgi:hypothetical protein